METNGIEYLKPVFNVTRDVSHLSQWQQRLYWWAFVPLLRVGYRLGLPVMVAPDGARVDIQSIADTNAIAASIVASIGESAFYIPNVPRNVTLPVAAVVFGGNRAPYSPSAALFEKMGQRREVAILCPISETPCTQHESITKRDLLIVHDRLKTLATS